MFEAPMASGTTSQPNRCLSLNTSDTGTEGGTVGNNPGKTSVHYTKGRNTHVPLPYVMHYVPLSNTIIASLVPKVA